MLFCPLSQLVLLAKYHCVVSGSWCWFWADCCQVSSGIVGCCYVWIFDVFAVWLLLFPLGVVVLLLDGNLLLFGCGQGLECCYVASYMFSCHGCRSCNGCKTLSLCILLSCALVLCIWSMCGCIWCLKSLASCCCVDHCNWLVWLMFCVGLCLRLYLGCHFISTGCYNLLRQLHWLWTGLSVWTLLLVLLSCFQMVQGLSILFACVGSGDPVRVLCLYTTNTLDILWSIYCWDICTTCRYQC